VWKRGEKVRTGQLSSRRNSKYIFDGIIFAMISFLNSINSLSISRSEFHAQTMRRYTTTLPATGGAVPSNWTRCLIHVPKKTSLSLSSIVCMMTSHFSFLVHSFRNPSLSSSTTFPPGPNLLTTAFPSSSPPLSFGFHPSPHANPTQASCILFCISLSLSGSCVPSKIFGLPCK